MPLDFHMVGGVFLRVPPKWVGLPAMEVACPRSRPMGHRPVAFLFALDLQPPTAVPFFPRLCNEDQPYLLKLTLTYFKYRPAKTAKTVLFSAAHARSGQQVST